MFLKKLLTGFDCERRRINRWYRGQMNFALVELLIVIVIMAILAGVAIPNFIAMQERAKEGSTKANMHLFQNAAEDWAMVVRMTGTGTYGAAATVANFLPLYFKNPYTRKSGKGISWDDHRNNVRGCVIYLPPTENPADSTLGYRIYGNDGEGQPLMLILTNDGK